MWSWIVIGDWVMILFGLEDKYFVWLNVFYGWV